MTPREESIQRWGQHPDVKRRIAALAAQLVASEISRRVQAGLIPANDDPDDPAFTAALAELMPDAVKTAKAALLAVEEYLCG